jgi:acyl-coenzyme A synthetase/AMP-(fatty) acid ligase
MKKNLFITRHSAKIIRRHGERNISERGHPEKIMFFNRLPRATRSQ